MTDEMTLICVFISMCLGAIALVVPNDKAAIVLTLIALFFMTAALLSCRQSIRLYGWDW